MSDTPEAATPRPRAVRGTCAVLAAVVLAAGAPAAWASRAPDQPLATATKLAPAEDAGDEDDDAGGPTPAP